MKLSNKGYCEIISFEGLCTAPYKDSVGVWTFGIGHTRYDGDPIPDKMEKGVDHPINEIIDLFVNKIQRYVDKVNKYVKVDVTQYQFDALVSICYNVEAFMNSTAIKRLNEGANSSEVAHEILMWNKPPEIMGRRRKESKLFETGIYSSDGIITITSADVRGHEINYRQIDITPYLTNL